MPLSLVIFNMDELLRLGDTAIKPTVSAIGHKAMTLHRLHCHGLPIPPGIVLSWPLALQVIRGDARARNNVTAATATLQFPLAVRSSASTEDCANGAAPGLFESHLNINTIDKLLAAITSVVASSTTPQVDTYLAIRGISECPNMAVIVQTQISNPSAHGVVYTRPPGRPDDMRALLERTHHTPLWIDRNTSHFQIPNGAGVTKTQVEALWKLASIAEEIVPHQGGLDIEWVWREQAPWLVQARPIVHRADLPSSDHPNMRLLFAFSRDDEGELWKLDATHNPFPCSPAQAGLIAAVQDLAPYKMRVVGGYLYTAQRPSSDLPESLSPEDLALLYNNELSPKMHRALTAVEANSTPSLADALRAYRQVFHCYTTELSPAIAATNRLNNDGYNPINRWLDKAYRGEITFATLLQSVAAIAPAWDVAVATYGENPDLVRHALSIPPNPHQIPTSEISIQESDDLFFYRAQFQVRRALLALASRWGVGDTIFFMSFQAILQNEEQDEPPPGQIREAEKAQLEYETQCGVEMPQAFLRGEIVPTYLPPNTEIWRGIGTGASVTGRVLRVTQPHSVPTLHPDDKTILVMPTVSPAHALLGRGAHAIICEYGDHLGHGAAMARELGIPCVVGCRRAWRELNTGDRVRVHGQAGLVARISSECSLKQPTL